MAGLESGGNLEWRRMFVGRQEELNWLKDAWRKVIADDGSKPEPQCVVLLAESGLGKTRLVQEFYRWLSREYDPTSDKAPSGYWPDAFASDNDSLDVNPRFPNDGGERGSIPWLWWGLRFERPFQRNQVGDRCGLNNYKPALAIHLHSLLRAKQIKEVRRSILFMAAKQLFDLIPFANYINAFKDNHEIWELLKQDRRQKEDVSPSLSELEQRNETQLGDTVFDYFKALLRDEKSNPQAVPAILFLDDAQWADPETLRFLARLLNYARKESWPLLVVATHWEAEWKETIGEPVDDASRPPRLSAITRALQREDQDYATWLRVKVVPTVSDLSSVIKTALPGLNREQQKVVLDKAGGNPLLLEEILLFLNRRPHFFTSADPKNSLSTKGLVDIQQRQFNLHELVDDRFQSLESTVKRALGWSSVQGLTFLTEVTLASAQAMDESITEERLRQSLWNANWPHSLIQIHGDRGEFKRSEFRQSAFHEVARNFLSFNDDELQRVNEAIRKTISGWILDDRIETLPAEEQLDALLMARRVLSPDIAKGKTDRKAWCRGMYLLAMQYQAQYLWHHALEVARTWARSVPNGCPVDLLDIWQQIDLCRLLRSANEYESVVKLTRSLIVFLQRSCHASAHETSLTDLEATFNELGDAQLGLGHLDDAIDAYRRGLEIAERIITNSGPTLENLWNEGISWGRIGDVERARGANQAAINAYGRSLKINEQIITQFGESHETLGHLASALGKVGDLQHLEGHFNTASDLYRKSLEVSKQLTSQFGRTAETLNQLGGAEFRMARVNLNQGRSEAALVAYRRGLQICEETASEFGETPIVLRNMTFSLNRIGDLELAEGHQTIALDCYQRALKHSEKMTIDFETDIESLFCLSISLRNVGTFKFEQGEFEVAKEHYLRNLAISQEIVTTFGESSRSLLNLIDSIRRVGDMHVVAENWEQAVKTYREGLGINEHLLREFGETPDNLHDLCVSLNKVGDLELTVNRPEEALDVYRRDLEISERIVQEFGETAESLSNLAISQMRMASIVPESEQLYGSAARKQLQRLIELGWATADQISQSHLIDARLKSLGGSADQ